MKDGKLPDDPAALAKLADAQGRWCVLFLALAIVLPLAVRPLFERQARRLDALAADGVVVEATVTAVETNGNHVYTVYQYGAGGTTHSWDVARAEAPYDLGAHFSVLYLPAHPDLSRPTTDRARVRAEAANNRSITLKVMLGLFLFFAFNTLLSAHKLWKLR